VVDQIVFPLDEDESDGIIPVTIYDDGSGSLSIRLSSNGTSGWSDWLPWSDSVDWHYLDPALGGSPLLGVRTLYAQFRDPAGNVSNIGHAETAGAGKPPLRVTPDVPVTGQTMTITPDFAGPVTYPAGTFCDWSVAWGDDQSLYLGEHDET